MNATARRTAPAPKAKPTEDKPVRPQAEPMPDTKARKVALTSKLEKVKKPKLVRDSFTIPKDEYSVLDELKQRCIKLAQPSKKSELLRAGIKALVAMSDKNLLAALQAVPSIKTGRPKKA